MDCKHKRYTVDVAEQTGRCMDCGAEGRMQFVVGDPVAEARERYARWAECHDLGTPDGAEIAAAIRRENLPQN